MSLEKEYVRLMDADIRCLVRNALRIAPRYPRYLGAFAALALYQRRAAAMRERQRATGISVPAFMIISVTRKCNLACKGCYSHVAAALESAAGRPSDLDAAALSRVVSEASALGVSFALLAGGEPLTRAEEIFTLARDNPHITAVRLISKSLKA